MSLLFQPWIFVVFDGEFVVDPHINCLRELLACGLQPFPEGLNS